MPSPIAHCTPSAVLLVLSLFLLGYVVPSSVGSTVDIKRQKEKNNDLSKHSTAQRKKGGNRLDCVPLFVPSLLHVANHRN